MALLAKQLWRLYQFPGSLVARVLKGRYYPKTHPLKFKKNYSPSYGWSSLSSARELLFKGCRMRVGGGDSISVWSDPWIPDVQPRPARGLGSDFYPDLKVNQLIDRDSGDWNVPLLNQLMDQQDVQLIRAITVRPNGRSDKVIWHFTKSGVYSVKSGYDLFQNIDHNIGPRVYDEPSTTVLKAHVWKVKCPSKIQHFLWQMLNGSLAVLARLEERGISVNTNCPRCGMVEETINHALFECPNSLQTWQIANISGTNSAFPSGSVFDNADHLFWRCHTGREEDGRVQGQNVFPWIIWFIWKSRNKKVFKGIELSPPEILQFAVNEFTDWSEAQVVEDQVVIENVLPPNDETGIYCRLDGSWKSTDLTAGLGWICCQENQVMLLGGRGIRRSLSPLHAELEALIWAMSIILHHDIPCYKFQTDSLELTKIIGAPEDWPALDIMLEEFRELRRRFPFFSLSFIRRESNSKADCLARSARQRRSEFSYVNNIVPTWITSLEHFL